MSTKIIHPSSAAPLRITLSVDKIEALVRITALKNMTVNSEASPKILIRTDFPELELHASGKVRDVYRVDNEHLLFVATDRISAFD